MLALLLIQDASSKHLALSQWQKIIFGKNCHIMCVNLCNVDYQQMCCHNIWKLAVSVSGPYGSKLRQTGWAIHITLKSDEIC